MKKKITRREALRLTAVTTTAFLAACQSSLRESPTDAHTDISIDTGIGMSVVGHAYCLHPIFIRPHRKDISHEHNSDAPRKRNP